MARSSESEGGGGAGRSVELRDWAEQLPDVADAVRSEFGADAANRFSAELFEFQRRRSFIYAAVMALFIAPFFVYDLWAALDAARVPGAQLDISDPVADGLLILLHAVFAAIFQRMRGDRDRLMRYFLGLMTGVGVSIVLYVWWATYDGGVIDPGDRGTWIEPFVFGATAIFCAGFAHLFASFFVALSPREALIPVIPVTVAYILTMLTLIAGPTQSKVLLIAAWPLSAAPGLIWSTWRYRKFVDGFRWKFLRTRLGDLRQDLADARRVHEALLPRPMVDGAVRVDFSYEPMRDIGGDYLFARRDEDGRVIILLVDVAGHGVASALAANRIHGELERLFDERPDAGIADAITLLNRFVHRALAPQAIFASAFAMEVRDGVLRWTNAGHPAAILLDEEGRIDRLEANATLLGVLDASTFECETLTRTLRRGDSVIACTDGVHEAADAKGVFFGEERFMSVARDARIGGPGRVPPALLDAVRRYRSGDPSDDVLVVALWRAE